tara:strand:+ start:521 stop:769 length:249 start_codon:yes stop_codon:yes gene_type:complete
MMENTITVWNVLLTVSIGTTAYFIKSKAEELLRLQVLLNKTREELAKEYVTKTEHHNNMNRIIDRLEALDAKLDRLMEREAR